MISIDKTKISKPLILNDIDWIQNKLFEIKDDDKPGKKITGNYNHKDVKIALNKLYNNKCAYCEGKIPEGFSERIDHFRPKNGIVIGKNKIENHKGYFWLGYEWTNLLSTCEKCNRKKSNKFPLKDETSRISDDLIKEGFLVNNKFVFDNFKIENLEKEKRLLLNPEIDKVEEHLCFFSDGRIEHLTEKGKKSIEIYDLNRKPLILKRKKIIEDMLREIIDISKRWYPDYNKRLSEFFEKNLIFSKNNEYSRFRYFIFKYFYFFIIDKFKNSEFDEFSKILTKQYKIFIKTNIN